MPLDWAVRNNHEDVVKLLLRHGAGAAKAQLSHDSIEYAAACGHESILRLLVAESDHFKELIVKSDVLVNAIFGRKEGVIKLLLEEGVDIGYVDSIGRTPLSWAARLGHGYIVDLLLTHGAAQRMDEQAKGASTSL
jgi:ankyrin repeat protein